MIKWKNHFSVRCRAAVLAGGLVRRYIRHGVGRSSAALTYYLVFAAFGLLVVWSAVLGSWQPGAEEILHGLEQLLPAEVVQLSRWYLRRISDGAVGSWWSMTVLTLWFPLRASSCLLWAAERALGGRKRPHRWLRTAIFTLWLPVSLSLILVFTAASRRVLGILVQLLGLPERVAAVAAVVRFAVLAAVMFMTLWLLYSLASPQRRSFSGQAPGVALTLAVWLAMAAGFSFYVTDLADYTRLYGSVAVIVVTLLWLYMTSAVLIMGAELNAVLLQQRKQSTPKQRTEEE